MSLTPKHCGVRNRCAAPGELLVVDSIASVSGYSLQQPVIDYENNVWMQSQVNGSQYGYIMWGTYDPDTGLLSYGGQLSVGTQGAAHLAIYPGTKTWMVSVTAYSSNQIIYGSYDEFGEPTRIGTITGFFSSEGDGALILCDRENGLWWYGNDKSRSYMHYGSINESGIPVKGGTFSPGVSGTSMAPLAYDPYLGLLWFYAGSSRYVAKYDTATGAFVDGSTMTVDGLYSSSADAWYSPIGADPIKQKLWGTNTSALDSCYASYDDDGLVTIEGYPQIDMIPWNVDFINKIVIGRSLDAASTVTAGYCFR